MRVTSAMLKRFRLLHPLPEDRLAALAKEMVPAWFESHGTLVQKGDEGRSLFFLVDGRCKIVDTTQTGREIVLAFLASGDHFGEMALIEKAPRSASVIPLTDCLILELPPKPAERLIFQEPEVGRLLMQSLTRIIQNNNEQQAMLRSPSAYSRVYSFLLSMAQRRDTERDWVVPHLPTHADIAAMTGTSRETVSRALATLQHQQVAFKENRSLVIPDREHLSRMSARAD